MTIKLYGVGLSPYVRKVRMALAAKGLEYDLIDVFPGSAESPAEFIENSPLGKIPLAQIDGNWLPDSSVIMAYLEKTRPETALLSDDPVQMARGLWFGEYVSSRMAPAIGGHLFAELILAPNFFKRESNLEEIELARTQEIPAIFDYLESQLNADYLISDEIGHADVCVGSFILPLKHCGEDCDAEKWPKTSAYIERIMSNAGFASIFESEQAFMKSMLG